MIEIQSVTSHPNPDGFGTFMYVVLTADKEPSIDEVAGLVGYPTSGYGSSREKKSPVGDRMWIVEWLRSNTCE